MTDSATGGETGETRDRDAVLVEFEAEAGKDDLVHSVALQVASMKPKYVHQGEVPAEVIEKERGIAEATAREEGKPEHIIPRIVDGRISDFYKDVCLHDQQAISDEKVTVGRMLDEHGVTITRFARFAAGN